MTAGDYKFGTRLLDDGVTYFATACDLPAAPVELMEYALGRYEGSHVADWRYSESAATVTVMVYGATQALAEAAVDALIKDLYHGQQSLLLGYADERYWQARLSGQPRVSMRTHAWRQVDIDFRVASAFAWAKDLSAPAADAAALTLVSGTHYSKTLTPTVGGTIYARPVITITSPSASITSIWVENTSLPDAPAIRVTRGYGLGDTLVIDCAAMTVKFNGAEVEYSGQFLTFDPRVGATNNIVIHATASSTPSLTAALTWRPRFAA